MRCWQLATTRHPKHIEIEYSLVAVEASTAGGQWACRRWSVFNNNDLSEACCNTQKQKQTTSPALSKSRSSAPQKQRRPLHLFEHAREVDSDEGKTECDTGGRGLEATPLVPARKSLYRESSCREKETKIAHPVVTRIMQK